MDDLKKNKIDTDFNSDAISPEIVEGIIAEEPLNKDGFSGSGEDDVDEINGYDEGKDSMDEEETQNEEEKSSEEEKKEDEKKEEKSETDSSEHDGKYFVIPKGMVMCDKGSKFPNFKVTSHTKHYWNNAEGRTDYLAVTEDDLMFNPPTAPFGTCAVKNGNPCTYGPAGKWTKTYTKVKVMGKSCVTEASELMCVIGGKITVMKHGQQSEAGKSNVKKADAREQHIYNPITNFEEFREEINGNEGEAW